LLNEIQLKFSPGLSVRHTLPCETFSQYYHFGYMQQLLFEFLEVERLHLRCGGQIKNHVCQISSGFCLLQIIKIGLLL